MTEIRYKFEMVHEYLRIHDEGGRLMMKVKRSKNRLYKIALRTTQLVCLASSLNDEAWLWHARLGHINFQIIDSMVRNNLVRGVPNIKHPTKFVKGVWLLNKLVNPSRKIENGVQLNALN